MSGSAREPRPRCSPCRGRARAGRGNSGSSSPLESWLELKGRHAGHATPELVAAPLSLVAARASLEGSQAENPRVVDPSASRAFALPAWFRTRAQVRKVPALAASTPFRTAPRNAQPVSPTWGTRAQLGPALVCAWSRAKAQTTRRRRPRWPRDPMRPLPLP